MLGASEGLGGFLLRHPKQLAALARPLKAPPGAEEYGRLLDGGDRGADRRGRLERPAGARTAASSPGSPPGISPSRGRSPPSTSWPRPSPTSPEPPSTPRSTWPGAASRFPADEVAATRLSIIGMGKAGARELNYLSDVDVLFVTEGADGLADDRAVEIATRLAMDTIRGIHELARRAAAVGGGREPPARGQVRLARAHPRLVPRLLRPLGEGLGVPGAAQGAAARRRPRAGGALRRRGRARACGRARRARASSNRCSGCGSGSPRTSRPPRWTCSSSSGPADCATSSSRSSCCSSSTARRMPRCASARRSAPSRPSPTAATSAATEAAEFAGDYRFLRLLEHRLQLVPPAPHPPHAARRRTRSACSRARPGCATTASDLVELWRRTQHAVRSLHERLFYRPLLSAVAALPGRRLAHERAGGGATRGDRLHRPGRRAAAHRRAHRRGLAPGRHPAQPAAGHAAVVRRGRRPRLRPADVPPALATTSARRTGSCGCCATRRARPGGSRAVLSSSRYVGILFERIPEAAAWLEHDEELRPRPLELLLEEAAATVARHADDPDAAAARPAHRPPPRGAAARARPPSSGSSPSRSSDGRSAT